MKFNVASFSNELFKWAGLGSFVGAALLISSGVQSCQDLQRDMAKEKVVQAAVITSSSNDYREQKDSIISRYINKSK